MAVGENVFRHVRPSMSFALVVSVNTAIFDDLIIVRYIVIAEYEYCVLCTHGS